MSLNGNGVVNIGSKLVHVVVEWSQMVLLSYIRAFRLQYQCVTYVRLLRNGNENGWLNLEYLLLPNLWNITYSAFLFQFWIFIKVKSRQNLTLSYVSFLTVDLSWKNLFCYRQFFAGQYPKRSNSFPKIQEIFKYFYFFFQNLYITNLFEVFMNSFWMIVENWGIFLNLL